jgi:hypothetical protein
VPEWLVEVILVLMPNLAYRSHHEFIIEAIRRAIIENIRTISKLKKFERYRDIRRKLKEYTSE